MHSECEFNVLALVFASTLSFLSVHTSVIEKPFFRWLNMKTSRERTLISQRQTLKQDQALINMVDQFAKYSKIQRRINSIDEELEQIKKNKPLNSYIVQLGFTYGFKFILILSLILLSVYYRYTPVLYLVKKIDLTPFTNFICYPNDANYVSFYFWVMCNAFVARLIKV